ncbi:hypothetical protein BJ912DRAFT_1046875 [Pholiota molesta]|nr:hypothetical protein BJ912DRAFT_1046875 [Pholiota molesta]
MRQRLAAKGIMDEYNNDINGFTAETFSEKFERWFQAILDTGYGVFQNSEYNKVIEFNNSTPNSGRKPLLEQFKGWFQGIFQGSPLPSPLKEAKGPQWTLAHGFFVQMGGFMLCESGRPIQTLIDGRVSIYERTKNEARLLWNIQQKVIDPPRITEEDIQDRSKGDAISKTLIILQTTWFVAQCIARWAQRLSVTELEVVTLGFAMLNGITYGLWWDKPQNVGRPVFLESKKTMGRYQREFCNTTFEDADTEANPQLRLGQAMPILRKEVEEHAYSPNLLWRLPLLIVQALGLPLIKMLGGDSTMTKMRVGMFNTGRNSGHEADYAISAIGALFGFVHLIPSWWLHFSSHQEMWLWRISAIIITADPVSMGLSIYFDQPFFIIVFGFFAVIGTVLYPIARIILLTLSLTALRSPPPGALQTIEWTTFIPHI